MNTPRALELGRPVRVGDLAAVHPGKPEKCLCRGTAEIARIGRKPGESLCARALDAFKKQCGARVQDTPDGPRWKIGMSPEEWPFVLMFFADARGWLWRRQFAAKMAGAA